MKLLHIFGWFIAIFFASAFLSIKLLKHGDVEVNLGLKPKDTQSFSIFHWTLNRIDVHNFSKISLFQVCNWAHKYDIICLSKTYLYSSTALYESSLHFEGCKMTLLDHTNNIKWGGIFIYYKESSAVQNIAIPCLDQYLPLKISIQNV